VDRSEELRTNLAASPTMRLVPLAGHVVSQRFGRIFGSQDGLTASSAAVLGVLGWGAGRAFDMGTPGRATHAELARRCMITPATLTGVVNTLVRAGYLRRERDQNDRRVVWLVLTDAGAERVTEIGLHPVPRERDRGARIPHQRDHAVLRAR
jgi:DNA-binding MarR family transcriptional regulator